MEKSLRKYADYVMMYNSCFNLTSSANAEDFYNAHIADALLAVSYFENYKDSVIYDIGSGCGIPGIPLALKFSSTKFVLVERSSKRANFLNNLVMSLGLSSRVSIECRDLSDYKNTIQVATFSALTDFSKIQRALFDSLTADGTALLYKGRLSECMNEDYSLFRSAEFKKLDCADRERTLVILKK